MHALHKDMSFSAVEMCVCSCVVVLCGSVSAREGIERTNSRPRPTSCCLVVHATSQCNLVAVNAAHPALFSTHPPPLKSQILSLQGLTAGLCAQNNVWIFPTKHQPAPLRHRAANAVVSSAAAAGSNYLNIVSGLITVM